MTNEEHAARAMLLAGNHGGNLWFDAATRAYRPRTPEGSHYRYSGCLDADTLKPLAMGIVVNRERRRWHHGVTEEVGSSPMVEKLSHEEHRARAMLLGRVYDRRDGTYCLPSSGDDITLSPNNMMDCETLEIFDGYPKEIVLMLTDPDAKWYDEPTEDGPWVRKDKT